MGRSVPLTVSLVSPSIPFKLWSLFCTTDNHFKFTHFPKAYFQNHQNIQQKKNAKKIKEIPFKQETLLKIIAAK